MLLEFKGIQSKVINKAKEKALLGAAGKEGDIGLLNDPTEGQGHGGPRMRAEEGSWGWMVGVPSGGAGKTSAPGGLIYVPSKLYPCYDSNGRCHVGRRGNLEGSRPGFPLADSHGGQEEEGMLASRNGTEHFPGCQAFIRPGTRCQPRNGTICMLTHHSHTASNPCKARMCWCCTGVSGKRGFAWDNSG